jgi:hypothetical protein
VENTTAKNLTRDFFEMLAIRISNAFDPVHLEKRRSRIAEIIGKYTNAELLDSRGASPS